MPRPLLWLSIVLAALVAVAAAAGIFLETTYAKESASWAAQGVGQDIVTLTLVVPLLVVSAIEAHRGSKRALLVWAGVLVYLVYSYTLYAFFIHFNALFVVYTAALGLSTYLLLFGIGSTDLHAFRAAFNRFTPVTLVSGFLWLVAGMFSLLWLSEIIPATVSGRIPASLTDSGLTTNPVYILDLALLLPGMIIAGILLKRRNPIGYFLAAPLLVNTILLGIAILGMMAVMAQRGLPISIPMTVIMSVLVLLELAITVLFLNHIHAPQELKPTPTKPGGRWMFGPKDLGGGMSRG